MKFRTLCQVLGLAIISTSLSAQKAPQKKATPRPSSEVIDIVIGEDDPAAQKPATPRSNSNGTSEA